jgi:hypothetical protein
MTAQLESTADFLAAKETLLNAMRHHAILQSLKQPKVIKLLGWNPYDIILTDSQIDAFCEAEEAVETEIKYWESCDAVNAAKTALIEASKPITLELVPAEHLATVKSLYSAIGKKNLTAKQMLVNLLIKWDVTR